MNELLVKYKNVDDLDDFSFIEATTYNGSVCDILPVIKQVDSIKLKDEWYRYSSSEFVPTKGTGYCDVLYIYVTSYDDEDDDGELDF